jgi:hypothetical protein
MTELLGSDQKNRVLDELSYLIFTGNLSYAEEENNKRAIALGFTLVPYLERKAKNCVKGISCGGACIAKSKVCRKTLVEPYKSDKKKLSELVSPSVDRSDYKQLIAAGEKITQGVLDTEELESARTALMEQGDKRTRLKAELDELESQMSSLSAKKKLRAEIEAVDKTIVDQQTRLTELTTAAHAQILDKIKTAVLATQTRTPQEREEKLIVEGKNKAEAFKIRQQAREAFELLPDEITTLDKIMYIKGRAYADESGRKITTNGEASTTWHELAHHLEFSNPDIQTAANRWREDRATGPIGKLDYPGNPGKEIGYPDKFVSAYVGRVYKNTNYTEVISMGFQHFSEPFFQEKLYFRDREHYNLMVGILTTSSKK